MSGFAALVQGLAQTGIQILGDLASDIVYQPIGTPLYDPITGVSTSSASSISGISAPIFRFGPSEMDQLVVVATDARVIIAALDLPGIIPTENDTITSTQANPGGSPVVKTWKVIRSMGVPGSALHKLHIREI